MNDDLNELPREDRGLFRKFLDFGLNFLVSSGKVDQNVGAVLKTVVPLLLDTQGNKASITQRVTQAVAALTPEQKEQITNISPAFGTVFRRKFEGTAWKIAYLLTFPGRLKTLKDQRKSLPSHFQRQRR